MPSGSTERARRELLATGETVRTRSVETRDKLTRQETQIARLASNWRTNPEIGTQLFISPRTVEWHLLTCSPSWTSVPAGNSRPHLAKSASQLPPVRPQSPRAACCRGAPWRLAHNVSRLSVSITTSSGRAA
jgi:Bacterial regulatory proteins, luxR family